MIDRAARWLAVPLTESAMRSETEPRVVAVLGAPVRGQSLSPVVAERVSVGIELYRLGLADLVCLTGTAQETDVMAEAAVAAGVADTDLLLDRDARNTRDNAANVAALLAPLGRRDVWVATQPFHSRRACFWFRHFGLRALPAHRDSSIQYDNPQRAVRWIAREYVSWVNLGIRMLLG